ncbi:hypothetical protein [Acetobacter sp. P5B1]|uniref:hypothetical protein n=1 Tax=Acetobacter sp. P5B1 TaxID=2762620 RepID=UPI001C05D00B|nr:hypothetical protein [Acetobacter sp. P5B1]
MEHPRRREVVSINFEKWLSDLSAIFAEEWGATDYVESTGHESWVCYWEDGYSPQQAFEEEASYA